jgi:hypothetical protein
MVYIRLKFVIKEHELRYMHLHLDKIMIHKIDVTPLTVEEKRIILDKGTEMPFV